jgi:hypothetical protein
MKKNVSRRMFILVMSMTVILVFVTTRRESYNPWLPWNWFRKPEPPRFMPEPPRSTPERPYPIPERPRSTPERPRPRSTPERPYPMPERPRPRPMPERPYPMPERPRPRPMDPRLALIPEHNMRPPDPSGLIFFNRPAQPLSPGVRARTQSR